MAFKYEPYQSTYVDPQSVKIAEILRDRFIQNFNAADAVGTELSKLKAADFENDQKLKSQIDADVRGRLGQYAESGAYEDMTFRVAETARDYRDRSAPVTENYNRYVAYQQDLAKQYQKGKISSKAYRNAIPMTKALGYSGISLDPNTGMVDPNSYFSGPSIVADPKITEQLIKVLNQIEADSSEKTISGLYVGEDGQMKYTSKQGWEGITEQKVNRAYEAVMALPEVQEYLNQEAKYTAYENYANPDGSLNPDALGQVTAAGVEMHKAEMNKLSALIGSPKTSQSKKQQYQATLNAYQQSMSYLEGLKDPAQQLNYAASLAKEQLLAPYQAIAAGKVYSKSSSSYEEDYSQMEREKRAAARAKQDELEKLTLLAESKITLSKEAGIDETISDTNIASNIETCEANIRAANQVLSDPNKGEYDKETAKEVIRFNEERLALNRAAAGSAANIQIGPAIDVLVSEKEDMGDIFNWGFGTYGVPFDQMYNSYKAFKGGQGTQNDFYRIISEGPGSADYDALAVYLEKVHSGENGKQILADAKAAVDTKMQSLGANVVKSKRHLDTRTAPIATNPIIADKTAEEVRSQFNSLGDLTNVKGLLFRKEPTENQVKGTVGGEGGIIESWSSEGFTPKSQIVGARWDVARGLELTDQSQYGQYLVLTVSPQAEGEKPDAYSDRPFKEIFIPIENVASSDQIKRLNEPLVKLQRYINTVATVNPNSTTQQYEFVKDFDPWEKKAIQFSNELESKSPADAAKFLKENAATFEEYVTKGYLERDGSFAGMTYEKVIVDVNIDKANNKAEGEIIMIDINGNRMPMIDPNTGNRAGFMDLNGERFKAIFGDENAGFFRDYNLKNIK